ncbi:MAG: hypothetical protein GX821_10015 [Clostridiaceae bacterium]|mgnify:FL=1|nr:hypothetical protein [Eubacteriales bacterium]MDD4743317.1 hypothetical protein [Eubacteriales bacterium]NLB45482.1 hypothetical protein [Clostridiaceae bacterium]
MARYQNFRLSLFFTVQDVLQLPDDRAAFCDHVAPFLRDLRLDKVYLETFRSETVPREKLARAKQLFAEQGIASATAMMPVSALQDGHETRIGQPFCYTDPWAQDLFSGLFRRMAEQFDEIMIDDSFLTNCTCARCREAKGERDWATFRMAMLTDFLERHMVGPAREVNESVKIVLKYPTYNESFQRLGYDPRHQPALVDGIHAGTETRHTTYSLFKNPRYTSYSLIRYLANLKEHNNGGGWIDNIMCGSLDAYLEQANLTLLAKAPELTLFCAGLLQTGSWRAALGCRLAECDAVIGSLGQPWGIPVYLPAGSSGEDHLYDYLGMCGVPLEPAADFPRAPELVLLTAASACDSDILARLRGHLENGGDAVLTTGFARAMQPLGLDEFIWIRDSGQKMASAQFGAFDRGWSSQVRYDYARTAIAFPFLEWKVNDINYHVMQMENALSNLVLGMSFYAAGRVMLLNTPDNYAQLQLLPVASLDKIRQYLSFSRPVRYLGQAPVSLFLYDNQTFALQSFLPHGSVAEIAVRGDVDVLTRLDNGHRLERLYQRDGESRFEIPLDQQAFLPLSYAAKDLSDV